MNTQKPKLIILRLLLMVKGLSDGSLVLNIVNVEKNSINIKSGYIFCGRNIGGEGCV